MKSKKLLFSTMLGFGCLGIYLTMTSSSGGMMGVAATGCGTTPNCHGAQANTTGITLTGIPATGYVFGTNYPVTLTVTAGLATLNAAGFDLTVSAGSLSNAPANTMLMGGGTELHHTAPKAMVSGSVSWAFNWTAPAAGTASTTINIAANAVNSNNGSSGDQWNKTTITVNAATPTSVQENAALTAALYPNPAADRMQVRFAAPVQASRFRALTLSGALTVLPATETAPGEYQLDLSNLVAGNYILLAEADGRLLHKVFSKK